MESELFGHKQRQLHRRRRRQAGPGPQRRGRHAVPRRGRRPAAAHAGEAAARDPGEDRAAGRRDRARCRWTCASCRPRTGTSRSWWQQGRFREDLYYRINVIELRVPALRERLEDVPQLVDMLLDRVSKQIGVPRPEISDEAMDKLLGYAYPGNVRELENILERAVTLCSNDRVAPEDIQLSRGRRWNCPQCRRDGRGRARGAAGAHPARGDRPGAGADALQQDQGGAAAGDDVPAAQVPGEEAGDRLKPISAA